MISLDYKIACEVEYLIIIYRPANSCTGILKVGLGLMDSFDTVFRLQSSRTGSLISPFLFIFGAFYLVFRMV